MGIQEGTEIGVQSDAHGSRVFLASDMIVICCVQGKDAGDAAVAGWGSVYRFASEKQCEWAYRLRRTTTERPREDGRD